MGKVNTLLDVVLQTADSNLKQLLLLVADITKDVDSLLGSLGLEQIM